MKHMLIPAFRHLRMRWVDSALAAIVLTVGIAAAFPITAALYGLLFKLLPVPRPAELVELAFLDSTGAPATVSAQHVDALNDILKSYSGVIGATSAVPRTLLLGAARSPVQVQFATPRYFATLEVGPAAGRLFTDADRTSRVAVISDRLWSRYGRDAGLIGKLALLEGKQVEIVGVAQPGFAGDMAATGIDMWLPSGVFGEMLELPFPPNSPIRFLHCLGRSPASARIADRELKGALVRLRSSEPALFADFAGASAIPAPSGLAVVRSRVRWYVFLMSSLAVVVLALCTTITSTLFYVDFLQRSSDFAVKLAVGASNVRIALEIATHALMTGVSSMLLAAGIDLALADGIRNMLSLLDPALAHSVQIEPAAMAVILSASPLIALMAAIPAVVSGLRLSAEGVVTRSATSRRCSARVQFALLAAQFAVCIAGLYLSVLFLQSVHGLMNLDLGFDVAGRYRTVIEIPAQADAIARRRMQQAVLTNVRELSMVQAAALASEDFLNGSSRLCCLSGESRATNARLSSSVLFVTPSFFQATGARLVSGRDFYDSETSRGDIAIINEALSRRLFGTGDGTGRMVRWNTGGAPRAMQVIATVRDMRFFDAHQPPKPTLYLPALGLPFQRYLYLAGPEGDSAWEAAIAGRIERSAGPASMGRHDALRSVLSARFMREAFLKRVSASTGALTLLLIILGLYALIHRFCVERAQEITIRRAIGASSTDVAVFVLRRFGMAAGLGTAGGILLGALAARALNGAFFEFTALDARTVALVVLLAVVVNVVAAFPALMRIPGPR